MTRKHLGRQSVRFDFPPSILSYASVVGKKEGEGPLAAYFDTISSDTKFGQQTWEKAESQMQTLALQGALRKASLSPSNAAYALCRGSSKSVHRHQLCRQRNGYPLLWALWSLLHHGRKSFSCRHGRNEGGYAEIAAAVTSIPFRISRAPIPTPAGIWRSAYPHSAMDRHRLRSHPGRSQSGSALRPWRYHRKDRGSPDHGCQQYGSRHGLRPLWTPLWHILRTPASLPQITT